ncbi:MAG TPA: hypothetical protein VJ953_08790 [Saprospiraceae bacterium]|nr:hypothetical protein [Saprospiraceae bacterium]
MDNKKGGKYQFIKYLSIFSIICLVVMMIRLGIIGEPDPRKDSAAFYLLIIAVVSGFSARIGKRIIQARS